MKKKKQIKTQQSQLFFILLPLRLCGSGRAVNYYYLYDRGCSMDSRKVKYLDYFFFIIFGGGFCLHLPDVRIGNVWIFFLSFIMSHKQKSDSSDVSMSQIVTSPLC